MPSPATPKPWLILQALQGALQQILIANGYRTDIGANVELEDTQDPQSTADGITLYGPRLTRPDEPDNKNTRIKTREFELCIEAATPISASAGVWPAYQRMHDIIEDIEQALDTVPSTPGAIPAQMTETAFVTRPQGLNIVVAQYWMTARYRR